MNNASGAEHGGVADAKKAGGESSSSSSAVVEPRPLNNAGPLKSSVKELPEAAGAMEGVEPAPVNDFADVPLDAPGSPSPVAMELDEDGHGYDTLNVNQVQQGGLAGGMGGGGGQ